MILRFALALILALVSAADRLPAQTLTPVDSTSEFDTTAAFAYYEYDSSRIVIRDDSYAEIHRKVKLRILRDAGLDHALITLYEDSFSKLEAFDGRVIGNDGVVIIKRSKKDMYKQCGFGPSYSLYDDDCTYGSNLSGGNFPFTIEYAYKRSLSSLFFWQGWSPQSSIPVLSSSYNVDAPVDFAYSFKLVPGDLDPTTFKSATPDRSIMMWSATAVPALDPPDFSPPDFDLACRLEFCPRSAKLADYPFDAGSWASLARSNYELFRDQLTLGSEADAVARQLLGTGPPTQRQLTDLHAYLMSRQRYVAVSIGVGGWKPHAANLTFRNCYGDCKDLATLYAAMLSVAGVEAHVALARTKDLGQIDPEFPSLAGFNHVILMYLSGADTVWVDATCSSCAVNDLPAGVEGIHVLVVDPDNGVMIRTHVSTPHENRIVRNVSLSLAADNSAQAVVDLEAYGDPGHVLKQMARDLTNEELQQRLQARGIVSSNFKIDRCVFDKYDSTLSRFACRITGSLRRASLKIDGRLHLKTAILDSPLFIEYTDLDSRTLPLVFNFPLAVFDTIAVTAPEGWQLSALPTAQSSTSDFGSLEIAADSAATPRLTRTHLRNTTRIEPADFAAFQAFQSECKRALATALVFQPR